MKALVLGGSGFIGSHIARVLIKNKFQVRVLHRPTSPVLALAGLQVESVIGDLADCASLSRAMAGCEVMFHAAGYYPSYSFERERQKRRALQHMHNVLQAASNARALQRIVYISSLSTIGRSVHGMADEKTTYDAGKKYGIYYEIKYLLEQEVLRAARAGLPVVVVNPTACFGDYDVKPTSGFVILHIAKGILPFMSDAPVNAVNVRDVAAATVATVHNGVIGHRYILGGHNTRVSEFCRLVAERAKVRPPMFNLPLGLGKAAAFSSELLGKYVFRREIPMLPLVAMELIEHGTHYDCSKAKRELDLATTPLEETVERALTWFREHGYL